MKAQHKVMKCMLIISLMVLAVCSLYGQQPSDFVIPLSTSISENPASISFNWNTIPGPNQIQIWRKSKYTTDWGDRIALLPADTTRFTDFDVVPGEEYEYNISKKLGTESVITYVSAGIKCREVEYRGKVILLVDSTFIGDLKNELIQYESDLIGDGWNILRKDISRNASVKYVKTIIRNFYYSDTLNVKAVILLGHIPVPYSGCDAYDGHPDHFGAWPADIYYGDMNENIWTDIIADCTTAERSENWNVPGDGKFDVTYLPPEEKISLQIGRIDFFNLPAFPQTEQELIKQYLEKDHNFRFKINDPKLKALVCDYFGGSGDGAFAIAGWRNFTALFNSSNVKSGEYIEDIKKGSYISSYACGPGAYGACTGVGFTSDFVSQNLHTVFTSMLGSYFGDWDSRNNFMRSALASKGWILTSMWSGLMFYTFHQMGMGETIGYCLQTTQNNLTTYDQQEAHRHIYISLMGDPTLRLHIVGPASSLQSAITANNSVLLAWKPADDTIVGYFVYKLDTIENAYHKISPLPITDTWFEDRTPSQGRNYYMVKSLKLSEAASGSYYNLSQGIFDTINYIQQIPVPVSGIELLINRNSRQPLKIYEPFDVDANVFPQNATNKLVKWSVENLSGKGRINVKGEIFPEKAGLFALNAEALDGSGCKGRLEIIVDTVPDPAGVITGELSLCRDNKRIFYNVPEIRGASVYCWSLPDGSNDTTNINELRITCDSTFVSGNIKVHGHNIYADGNESTLSVIINEIPPRPFLTLEGNVLRSNAPTGNNWYLNNILIPNASDSIYFPEQNGRYYVIVSLNECPSGASNLINYIPTGIGLKNLNEKMIIFPNPTERFFSISLGDIPVRKAILSIFSLQGSLVYSEIFQNTTNARIDLNLYPKGLYFIKVTTSDCIYNGKICLE